MLSFGIRISLGLRQQQASGPIGQWDQLQFHQSGLLKAAC